MPGAVIDANSGSFITSETSGVKLRHRKAMTIKNLAAYLFNCGDPDTVTVDSRKNGANGNLTCSIGSSNALGQDTSHSDSIAVGDDYDFSFAGEDRHKTQDLPGSSVTTPDATRVQTITHYRIKQL
jgi:hypothetical protein